jgi:type II secretory pathway pseudopilin PulG
MAYLRCNKTVDSPCRLRLVRARSSRGFTFVELLATMVFIAVLLPTALRGIALCTTIAGDSRKQIEAAALARTQLTDLIVTGDWENGARNGDFGSEWPGYKWTCDVSNWTEATNVSLRQVDVTVTWSSRNTTKKLTLSTLVYKEDQ